MRFSRFLAALSAAMLLVVYWGCGDDKKDSTSGGSSGATPTKAADTTGAKAPDKPSAPDPSAANSTSSDKAAIHLSYIGPNDFAAVVTHPKQIAQSPLVAEQLKNEKVAASIKSLGFGPADVDEVVTVMALPVKNADGSMAKQPDPRVIVYFAHPVDAKQLLANFQETMQPGKKREIKEVPMGGKTLLEFGPADAPLAYVPDATTIVLVDKDAAEQALALGEPKGALVDQLKKADAGNDLTVAGVVDVYPNLDKIIEAAKTAAPPIGQNYLDAAKTLHTAILSVNLTGDTMLQVVLDNKDTASADALHGLLKDGVKVLDGALTGFKQNVPKDAKAQFADAFKLGDEAIAGITVTKDGTVVTAVLKRPADMDKAGDLINQAMKAFMPSGRAKAGPIPGSEMPPSDMPPSAGPMPDQSSPAKPDSSK